MLFNSMNEIEIASYLRSEVNRQTYVRGFTSYKIASLTGKRRTKARELILRNYGPNVPNLHFQVNQIDASNEATSILTEQEMRKIILLKDRNKDQSSIITESKTLVRAGSSRTRQFTCRDSVSIRCCNYCIVLYGQEHNKTYGESNDATQEL